MAQRQACVKVSEVLSRGMKLNPTHPRQVADEHRGRLGGDLSSTAAAGVASLPVVAADHIAAVDV